MKKIIKWLRTSNRYKHFVGGVVTGLLLHSGRSSCTTLNKMGSMAVVFKLWKFAAMAVGGMVGWLVAEFRPTFPLIAVAIIFILYDAYTAFKLDKRVHAAYPEKTDRKKAKFTSFAFGKVVKQTIPKRLWLIVLAYLVEHWVFIHMQVPLSYILTGVICFEQAWSILENESSCRPEAEHRFWKALQQVMVDKTARHFDVNLDKLKEEKDDSVD